MLTITIGTERQCRYIYCSAIFLRARQITLGYMQNSFERD